MKQSVLFVLCGVVSVGTCTQVNQCPGGDIKNLNELITIENCDKPPCRLRKNTAMKGEFKFIAEDNYKSLTQYVTANIAGIDFPFVGVYGTNACDKIFEEDGTTKSNCEFVKGKMYVFKNSFDILQIYPRVKTVVRWAITDKNTGKHAFCFEVPVSITN